MHERAMLQQNESRRQAVTRSEIQHSGEDKERTCHSHVRPCNDVRYRQASFGPRIQYQQEQLQNEFTFHSSRVCEQQVFQPKIIIAFLNCISVRIRQQTSLFPPASILTEARRVSFGISEGIYHGTSGVFNLSFEQSTFLLMKMNAASSISTQREQ